MTTLTSNHPAEFVELDPSVDTSLLADPEFNIPAPVELIIGVAHFFSLLTGAPVTMNKMLLPAQPTVFGLVIGGLASDGSMSKAHAYLSLESQTNVDQILRAFWEIEENQILTTEQRKSEELFTTMMQRSPEGRFIVSLPICSNINNMGASIYNAQNRLKWITRRFAQDPEYKAKYVEFMQDYLRLGHMERIPPAELNIDINQHFYLPHHAVFKSDAHNKIRVVFDGSCKSKTGLSINDCLMAGATCQRDLFSILLSFRKHQIALVADIEKMYRQVLVREADRNYQRIVWHEDSSDPILHFRLTTVTYGTAAAPFLATRALLQISNEIKDHYPELAAIIADDFYVDDLLTGTENVETAVSIKNFLIKTLASYGFNLTKWKSNVKELSDNNSSTVTDPLTIVNDHETKVLGLQWDPNKDMFMYKLNVQLSEITTKRRILSESSKIFDPLGFLTPVTIKVKIIFQRLWLLSLSWDDPVPSTIANEWRSVMDTISTMGLITIPRQIICSSRNLQFHGFADASELAYAAVIYCRSEAGDGSIIVRLMTAKSKVAPLKQISIPRLELCAAHLLCKLMKTVIQATNLTSIPIHAWSDSSVVLAWLQDVPRKWKPFVANRTAEILEIIPGNLWNYVKSSENPADCASRGILPSKLKELEIWWSGPKWLHQDKSKWPSKAMSDQQDKEQTKSEERQKSIVVLSVSQQSVNKDFFERCSSWGKLIRVCSYVLRFINNAQLNAFAAKTSFISTGERKRAKLIILKLIQSEVFPKELQALQCGQPIPKTSRLLKLNPFIGQDNLIRVGGRLQDSNLPYNMKHPVILPKVHHVTVLIIRETHLRNLHTGPSLMIFLLRQDYWILGLRQAVRKVVHACTVCVRHRQAVSQPLMGNLPQHRVVPNRPFNVCGVDFAGPVQVCHRPGRGAKPVKAYIALFICFSTKAVHVELVSSLSSEAFISTMRRFVARRGCPSHMYSDNGTNFVGANRQLKESLRLMMGEYSNQVVMNFLAENDITWHFNPPGAPHFGGLWESNVKSVKRHLTRVTEGSLLSFEEMTTLLCQIESLLNSRPLAPISDDISCITALTPNHFLVGDASIAVPEPSLEHLNMSRLNRWQQVQSRLQGFWKIWQNEYLTSMQQRPKWQQTKNELHLGDLVIIREPGLPPARWLLARIEQLHPGQDNISRVATLRTAHGILKRPVVKLIKLLDD